MLFLVEPCNLSEGMNCELRPEKSATGEVCDAGSGLVLRKQPLCHVTATL